MWFRQKLKRHPFPVVAWFERVAAVSFAFPEGLLRPMVGHGLELDTYEGFGFVTVALVWTKNLRPAGVPRFLGQDFFLAGYRIFTRLGDDSGRRLRGLKILRSETDKRRMVWMGNLLTHYGYAHVRAEIQEMGSEILVKTSRTDGTPTLSLTLECPAEVAPLPPCSPFPDWRTARLFAGPMPFTFSEEGDGAVLAVEGGRENWRPRGIVVKEWEVGLFNSAPFSGTKPILANAFAVEGISYRWEKGRIVRTGGVT